jgi:hypothetical protein
VNKWQLAGSFSPHAQRCLQRRDVPGRALAAADWSQPGQGYCQYMLRYSRGILLVPATLLLVTCHSNPRATHPTKRVAGHVTRPTSTAGTPLDHKPCWMVHRAPRIRNQQMQ